MIRCELDICMFYKFDDGPLIVCVYVDDIFCVGDKTKVDELVAILRKQFTVKILGVLEEYIGCKIIRNGQSCWLHQLDLLKKVGNDFDDEIRDMQTYATPLPAGMILYRPKEGDMLLPEDQQRKYRSGVGSLLYLVKLSRPDLANSTRELSKSMDYATQGHYKMLCRVIKYAYDSYNKCLKMKPDKEEKWELKGYSDSDFAADKDTRLSVSGYMVYLCGVLISWKSKGQRVVALSSTEAEYMAFSELVREVLYIKQLLEFIGVEVQLPIKLMVDNVGAIYLAKDSTSSGRTKHIDIKYHFCRKYIEDGTISIEFVKTGDNDSDICTKNTSRDILEKHTDKCMETVSENMME